MKNRISFCVNACKKSTFRFIGGLQNVLRFLLSYRFGGYKKKNLKEVDTSRFGM